MMDNLKQEAYKLRMTPEEKLAMKASVFGAPAPASIAAQPSSYFQFNFQFLHTRVLVPAFAVVLVFGGVGTAAAAQGTLPGDLLYPVKLSVNEGVELALATSPKARAEVSAKLAERRVEEAETLAAQGKLNAAVGEELAANFEEHAQNADEQVDAIEAQDPVAAVELRTKLDSSLLAHGEILATLTVGGAKENQEGTGVVAARVLARTSASPRVAYAPATLRTAKGAPAAAETMTLMVASDTATGSEATGTLSLEGDMIEERSLDIDMGNEQAALRAQARARETFARLRALFEDSKADLSAAAVTQVSGELVAIEVQMELGSTTLMSGHFDEAQGDYAEALARATKLYVLLKAQARIEQNIISPILEQNVHVDPTLEVGL